MVLNAVDEFIYTPTADFQLVLGTNGCGKSTLLRELSPLPGNHKLFRKGGSNPGRKEIHISHGKHNYICTSVFNSGTGKHSFLKDGVELNTGGTPTIQKELVLREFKLDQELHDLLTGRIRLSSMDTNRRRYWMTKLSTADYTYVLSFYKRVTSAARDALANVKQHREKILADTTKLLAIEDVEGLEDRIQDLTTELNHLFRTRIPNLPGRNQAQHEFNMNMGKLEALSESIVKANLSNLRREGFDSLTHVREFVATLEGSLQASLCLMEGYTKQFADLESFIRALTESGANSMQDLLQVEARINGDLTRLHQQQKLFIGPVDPVVASQAIELTDALSQIFRELPDNSNHHYTKQGRADQTIKKREFENLIGGLENQMASIERRQEMILGAKDSTCPKCGYVWKEGLSEGELELLDMRKSSMADEVANKTSVLEQINNYIETVNTIEQQYGRYRQLMFAYPRLEKLWAYINENDCLRNNPASYQMLVLDAVTDFEHGGAIHRLMEENEHVADALKKMAMGEHGGSEHYSQRLKTLEAAIATEGSVQRRIKQELAQARAYYQRVEQAENTFVEVAELVHKVNKNLHTLLDVDWVETVDDITRSHQVQLSNLQRKMTEMSTLKAIIADREKDLDELILRQEALKLIESKLNPKNGLIASLIIGFVNSVTEHLNAVIDPIWTHDLIVQPCAMADGDLDYKFPFTVSTGTDTVDDVSEGSDGQVEIFDFAFKLTAMMYLQLEDYPLIIDELGRTFDQRHRFNLMTFLKNVIDSRVITQVFMSSHYAAEYSTLTSAEVLVIDPSNITVPDVHNQHVIMR